MTSRTGKPHTRQENRRERRRRRAGERAIESGKLSTEQRDALAIWHRARYASRKAGEQQPPAAWDKARKAWVTTLPGKIESIAIKGTITV
jgi:hypothetical protein